VSFSIMPPIAVLSVVPEKEAHDCEPALEGAKRYLPIKVFSAHKSVQGVGAAQVSCYSWHRVLARCDVMPCPCMHPASEPTIRYAQSAGSALGMAL
jgi:hypothetical protein